MADVIETTVGGERYCHGCYAKAALHQCSGCGGLAVYCSQACQTRHWAEHADACTLVSTHAGANVTELSDEVILRVIWPLFDEATPTEFEVHESPDVFQVRFRRVREGLHALSHLRRTNRIFARVADDWMVWKRVYESMPRMGRQHLDNESVMRYKDAAQRTFEVQTIVYTDLQSESPQAQIYLRQYEKLQGITNETRLGLSRILVYLAIWPSVGRLTGLRTLDIGYNALPSMPAELGQLTQLEELSASGRVILSTYRDNVPLAHLKELSFSSIKIDKIPTEIIRLTSLKKLVLSHAVIHSIPSEIGQLVQLTYLGLYANQIGKIPKEIVQLVQLRFLDLSNNQIHSIPTEIGRLTQLVGLYLSINQIRNVPAEIVQLTQLRELLLYDNKFPAMPEVLKTLRRRIRRLEFWPQKP